MQEKMRRAEKYFPVGVTTQVSPNIQRNNDMKIGHKGHREHKNASMMDFYVIFVLFVARPRPSWEES